MTYGKFAQTYDELMDKSLYLKWFDFVKNHIPRKSQVLEVACGTGDLSNLLQDDYTVLSSDISEDMLAIAQSKYPKLTLVQADMCALPFDQLFDAIICFADSICYLPDETALKKAFQSAYHHLKDNGIYLFDVHSIYQMDTQYEGFQYHAVSDDSIFVWDSYKGEYPHSVEHDITCCLRLENGLYERYAETHVQRTYPLETYKHILKAVGFTKITVTADFGKSPIDSQTTRWFLKAEK